VGLVAFVGASIGLVAACSGAGTPGAISPSSTAPTATVRPRPTTTRSATTSTVATPTTRPVFSFDDSVPPPELVNTGNDYVAILASLESNVNWETAHHPDLSLVPRVAANGTKFFTTFSSDVASLHKLHQRLVETLGLPTTYTITSTSQNAFSAKVVEDIDAHQLFDSTGHVIDEARFSGLTTYSDLLVRDNGRWRFALADVIVAPERLP
jgi:hypothetical protein